MTKKHFIALADALRQRHEEIKQSYAHLHYGSTAALEHEKTMQALADFCLSQNPRFDRERWLGYIAGTNGPNGGKR